MALLTPPAVRKQIESGAADPVYLLQGEDEVEKSALAHEFEELVEEGLRAFNVDRVHAGESRPATGWRTRWRRSSRPPGRCR